MPTLRLAVSLTALTCLALSGCRCGGDEGGGDGGADTGSCVEGVACEVAEVCRTGRITCVDGVAHCVATGNKPDGTACGVAMVCAKGACVGDGPGDGGPDDFGLSGIVTGPLSDSMEVTLTHEGGAEVVTLYEGARELSFDTRLPGGTSYEVRITRQPVKQACRVLHGEGTVPNADVADVEVDCKLRPSCRVLLEDMPGLPTGYYRLFIDAPGPSMVVAWCDMDFDGGGWTLVLATADGLGPGHLSPGDPAPGSATYLAAQYTRAVAADSSQVHVRTAGHADTESITSVADAAPIHNLRDGRILNLGIQPGDDAVPFWTGPRATSGFLNVTNCAPDAVDWPNVYHACGNHAGLHFLGDRSAWDFGDGTATGNIDMEVYLR